MADPTLIPLQGYQEHPPEESLRRAEAFLALMRRRRSVRSFSDRPVPRSLIERCLLAAGTAPSGANLQPWQFVIVGDPEVKKAIRLGAEEEERAFYQERAPRDWLDALAGLGTDWRKPFLEVAPWLIVIFALSYGVTPNGRKIKHYYVQESVGIAAGVLITALHHCGLATLTHTPSPMGFLNEILDRPARERPYLILVAGYPASDARVPLISKKGLDEFALFIEG